MKILITLITTLFCVHGLTGQTEYLNHECENMNITLKSIGEENPLYPFLIDEDREGVLEVHPFSLNDIGGWEALESSLSTDPNIRMNMLA